ncbi:hypothetical protein HY086_02230 [Candidatus Gottesmanbacteria bacterium]|nr:hypothetical protein [Candidatus Gottesmanbacteria bacterium]
MKISKTKFLAVCICIALFIIPFFWLKSGEMDLGGDSGRLYFYDPVAYLRSTMLYGVIPSGVGGTALSYFAIPFVSFLAVLHFFINSPTVLISFVNGVKLSLAFFSFYLIVKELLILSSPSARRQSAADAAAMLAGLMYVFIPSSVGGGWDRALLTHNQIFINPLMFYLFLRYLVTDAMVYFHLALLVTFIFSLNFSLASSPGFFAFFPISVVFLLILRKSIMKKSIPYKELFFGLFVFVLLQSFQILPHVLSLFSYGSGLNSLVFSDNSSSSLRAGLDYFEAVASNIKLSLSLMNLPQGRYGNVLSLLYFVFPITVLLGYMRSKSKTYIYIGFFFLVTMFFYTAKITDTGFAFYKALFRIPGFSMFRNYSGQWNYSFIFYYSLIVGFSFYALALTVSRRKIYVLIVAIATPLFFSAWPLVNGSIIRPIHHQSDNVPVAFQMDPSFQQVLRTVRDLPTDEKVLSLPLAGPGYQVVAGKNGGAYIGPSMFSYLTGRNDFAGYDSIGPFGELFLNAVKKKDLVTLRKIFALYNIGYIFYNADPKIYDDSFPKSPYDYVKDFMPQDQRSYGQWIHELPIDQQNKISVDRYFTIYPLLPEVRSPHIYASANTVYTNDSTSLPYSTLYSTEKRLVTMPIDASRNDDDAVAIIAQNDNPLIRLRNNYHLHRHEPFVSRSLDDWSYPFVLIREKLELWRARKNPDRYLDFSLFFLSKRMLELQKWKETIPISDKLHEPPRLRSMLKVNRYNSWEASFLRYEQEMYRLMFWLDQRPEPFSWKTASKIKIKEQLLQHEAFLESEIRKSRRNPEEEKYLFSFAESMFQRLEIKLALNSIDPTRTEFLLRIPKQQFGEYEPYLINVDAKIYDTNRASLFFDNNTPSQNIRIGVDDGIIRFDRLPLNREEDVKFTVTLPFNNIVSHVDWTNSGHVLHPGESLVTLDINTVAGDSSGGLIKQISNWNADTQYVITFDYLTFGHRFSVKIFEKQYDDIKAQEVAGNTFFTKNLTSRNWQTHQSFITSGQKSTSGFIQILGDPEDQKSVIQIRNFSIVPVPKNPTVLFKKIKSQSRERSSNDTAPEITFRKINLTKYEISVRNAIGPYTLVFLEAYHNDWKLFDPKRKGLTFFSPIGRLSANIASRLVRFFVPDTTREERTVGQYDNGNVKELQQFSVFLEPKTFDSWGKPAIAVDRHVPSYGYANAWNIVPDDMNGKQNYSLILEYTGQRRLYPLLLLSTSTAIILCVFLLKSFRKK